MSLEKDYNKELYHYGVKGMKWGKRKAQPQRSLYARITGSDKYYNEMMGNFRKDAAKKSAAKKAASTSQKSTPKKQPSKQTTPKSPAKKTSNGKKKANKVLVENGNKTLNSLGKSVQFGMGMAQIQYNMSGAAQRNGQTATYLNTLSGMSNDYKKRFVY